MKILYFDVETTGLDHTKHAIHQLAGIIEIDGEIKETFNIRICPHEGALIDETALEVAGVTKDKIMTYENSGKAYKMFIDTLSTYVDKYNKEDKFFLAGYNNAKFDNEFLRRWFELNNDKYFGSWFWNNSLDVMVLSTQYFLTERNKMPDFKLKTVAGKMGFEIDENYLHDALYDIELTRKIYKNISVQPLDDIDW